MLSIMALNLQKKGLRNGKNPDGTIKLEAMHRAGMLSIIVSDDGRGIDMNNLRKIIVEKILSGKALQQT